ncbi:MAG: flagellar hook capping FlgD N-terminal domain-containing protein [Erythrobacter sp.]|jgi:flagellar basal-body rod modification protein FlgD|nr:flagellar hook capping FlgD N-terminal domain-containing protein [Erythrobacter sp.]
METAITLPGAGEPLRTELADFETSSRLTGGGLGALTQADFLRLLTTQLANQDPLEPVSNEEMLSQMAQFSSLEAETRTTQTLEDIALKIDAMVEAQQAALEAEAAAREAEAQAGEELSPFEQASLDTLALIALQLGALTELQQATFDAVTPSLAARDEAQGEQASDAEATEKPAAVLPATAPIS